jgi:Mg2+-importing ATPase
MPSSRSRDDRAGGEGAPAFWSLPAAALVRELGSSERGLSTEQASARLEEVGPNELSEGRDAGPVRAFLAQLSNPLAWLLLFAVGVSSLAREWTDAAVVLGILLLGATLGFVQERRASSAIAALRARVALRCEVVRDGRAATIDARRIVPGDVVRLSAGSLIPADGVIIESNDFFVSEAVLTGESYPAEKAPGITAKDASLARRTNCVFQGTSVRSGMARVLIVKTGGATEYGRIAARLALRPAETDFDHGIRRFGQMLTRVMFVLVMITTAANILGHKPPVDSLLFAIALAVGLAPEMLPAIVAVNLSRGARDMAARGVIVRKLSAIENFGAMDVLCTDKTGTLTEGRVTVREAVDPRGAPSARVLELAGVNASMQTGMANPLDDAIVEHARRLDVASLARKMAEIPYDFARRRLSVVARFAATGEILLVTKGALDRVLQICDRVRTADLGEQELDDGARAAIRASADAAGAQGVRVLGVASRVVPERAGYTKDDEAHMIFEGTIELMDPPKAGVAEALRDLRRLGVDVKIVSGDARAVAAHLASAVGIPAARVVTGSELLHLKDEALLYVAERAGVFAEVDPNQKERIILALRKTGHVVGYMGDGINDAAALHAADVSVSVEGATDVAREAADFVLLRRDLLVLRDGILEGRVTFTNTLKYLFTTESANFGNMVSMAIAAFFLPFLPLYASQVLLNNLFSDVPAMAIASDEVDPEHLERPCRWDMAFMRRFMISFGLLSSVFDLLTFGVLLWIVRAQPPEFRTAWFVESLFTELFVALVVRTRRPFYRSRPSRWLVGLTAAVAVAALALPYTPLGALVELVPLRATLLVVLFSITLLYVASVELMKRVFFARLAAA